jgi:hypothetical protein
LLVSKFLMHMLTFCLLLCSLVSYIIYIYIYIMYHIYIYMFLIRALKEYSNLCNKIKQCLSIRYFYHILSLFTNMSPSTSTIGQFVVCLVLC